MAQNYYLLLGVSEDASQKELGEALKEKINEVTYRFDGDEKNIKLEIDALLYAYKVLMDPSKREAYNKMLPEIKYLEKILPNPDKDTMVTKYGNIQIHKSGPLKIVIKDKKDSTGSHLPYEIKEIVINTKDKLNLSQSDKHAEEESFGDEDKSKGM